MSACAFGAVAAKSLASSASTLHARLRIRSDDRAARSLHCRHGVRQGTVVLAVCCACGGCVDPGTEFDAFVARARNSRRAVDAGGDASTCAVHPGDVEGQYLLAISVTLAPTKPILTLTDLTTPALGAGTGLSFDAQPLSAADRRTPVGQKVALGPFPVDQNGAYRAQIPNLQVTGAANPVTGGDIAASVVLTGSLCGDKSFFCGNVTGNVTKPVPLNLDGSTFTLSRVDSAAALPARPAIDCAGNLADPL